MIPAVILLVVMVALALPATDPLQPPVYRCVATTAPVAIDGKLDDPAWSAADWTSDFVGVTRGDCAALRTRAKLLWDDRCLYVAAEMEQPDVQATMRQRDMPLFKEDAFELFLDPNDDGRDYLELEISALGTIFDLIMDKPYRDGGQADAAFNVESLKSAVHIDGTLNDPADRDRGWTVEIAIAWESLKKIVPAAPKPGARWRMELGRSPGRPGGRFVTWAKHGQGDMHMPEKWGVIEFVRSTDANGRPKP
jgi:hypothetical protein